MEALDLRAALKNSGPHKKEEKSLLESSTELRLSHGLYLSPWESFTKTKNLNVDALPGENRSVPMRLTSLTDEPVNSRPTPKKKREILNEWFQIPEKKLTPELMGDLKAIQLRGVADPKHFFKKTDFKKLPTKFHVAKVIGGHHGVGEKTAVFSHSTKKPKSILSEMLRDKVVRDFTERKAQQLHEKARSGGKAWYKRQKQR